jgi:hypothetical protein
VAAYRWQRACLAAAFAGEPLSTTTRKTAKVAASVVIGFRCENRSGADRRKRQSHAGNCSKDGYGGEQLATGSKRKHVPAPQGRRQYCILGPVMASSAVGGVPAFYPVRPDLRQPDFRQHASGP